MINNSKFIERLQEVMRHYQLSAAGFADEISVQRSSISHLLSGRNKPSLDFVLKVLARYETVDLYWLLNGKGSFLKKNMHITISNIQQTTLLPFYINKEVIHQKGNR